jgi:poly(A) polymerase
LLVDSGLAEVFLPELPALRLELDEHHRHKDVYEHSLIVLEQAIALESRTNPAARGIPRGRPGPDLVLRLAALLHDIGKPATRTLRARRRRELPPPRARRRAAGDQAAQGDALRQGAPSSDVARLVELHLRFHGYGEGQWTDSAVRRYVTDAGPLLGRLHLLTRSDCTTRNVAQGDPAGAHLRRARGPHRPARGRGGAGRVRPELDGNEIGAGARHQARPGARRGLQFLLALRLDEGLLGSQEAERRLRHWWAERGGA